MKKILAIIFCLILSGAIVFGWPLFFDKTNSMSADHTNSNSIIEQKIIKYDENEHRYNKIYLDGKLIGIINDYDYINERIDEEYVNYSADFPNSELGLGEDLYVVPETSFAIFENVDDKIMDYLIDNSLLGVKTTAIEFSTKEGVYDIIYVKNIDDFYEAKRMFLLNFVSEETLTMLSNGETINGPEDFGSVEMGLSVLEKTNNKDVIVSPEEIMLTVNDIYNYLCYGRNPDRQYYTVKQGDTLQGVGYHYGDMTPKQIMMLNQDVLSSEKQIITPGMQLNVTYYTSPLTIVVTKQDLSQQFVYPENPTYVHDESLSAGEAKIIVQEEAGLKNVLYEETWINGVLQSGTLKSETVVKEVTRGVIAIGTKGKHVSNANFIWPIDNPAISCHYGCYLGHTGTDFVNKYNHYGNVYAADSGYVYQEGYASDMGNYIMIDHQNGLKTWYMHMNVPAYFNVGDYVERGTIIGQIGNTGRSDGPHLHLQIIDNDERVNACYYLPCALLGD